LIIAECPDAISTGAAIALVRVQDNIKFELNISAADKVDLTFDARVLRIAHAVHK
ncbi:MAG: YfiR family protein, partial [Planctomycetes bacterium]|nr:YfiR family protein [Planctomycetota bacterium]